MDKSNRLLLRPIEAAEVLAIGRSRMYEMIRRNEIPVVRIGKSVRVPAGALRAWIEARTTDFDLDHPA